MTGTAGLADVHVLVVDVADLADDCGAVHTDETDFAGGQADLCKLSILCHQLRGRAGGADELGAAARIELDVVDDGTNRDVGDRQAVAGLDIRGSGGQDGVAGLQADRSEDVAKLAVLVLDQSDERAAVGVVLEALHDSGHLQLVAAEVDDAVLALVAAAVMTDAVAAAVLLDGLEQAALGLCLFVYAVKRGNSHVSSRRGIRLKRFDRHIALLSLQID